MNATSCQYDVFLSHNSADKPAVRMLADRLEADGLSVWFDERVIQPGDSIPLAIEQGLQESRVLLLVMSDNFFRSEWATFERHTGHFRDPLNKQRRVLPVLLSDTTIPDALAQFAYVDYRRQSQAECDRILQACK